MDTNEARATFHKTKNACVDTIANFFKKRNICLLPFGEWGFSDTPIIIDGSDDYDTYTLDEIYYPNGRIYLDCSSSDDNDRVAADELPIELLIDLVEWLQDNEEEIDEYLAEESEE